MLADTQEYTSDTAEQLRYGYLDGQGNDASIWRMMAPLAFAGILFEIWLVLFEGGVLIRT